MNNTLVLYYGVYIPVEYEGASALDGDERVFTSKTEALILLKKFKGRLKSFRERNEALAFACSGLDVVDKGHSENESSNSLLGEKPSLFKGPKSQDLVQLRKAIESETSSFTRDLIWKNPRYLISSGDTPTILQEGSRYNGLHVACKAKRPDMCGLILEAISDAAFLQMLYPDDTPMIREDRILFLLDLYLNMPDKALNETPLHFASKYGCAACVELLVNYPQCNRHRRNKYEQTPRDMICSRVNKPSPDLVATMEVLLGDRYFVPVLRSEDWSTQPSIGEPWSPDVSREPTLLDGNVNRTPKSSASRVMAYAGPMSPSDARHFYQQWKTPPSRNLTPRRPATPGSSTPTTSLHNDAKLRDPDKGLETVGRLVAKGMGVKWQEYWPFLDTFCDISSEAGLVAFEQYLKSRLFSVLKTPSLEEVTQKLERLICHEESSSPIKRSPPIPTSPMSDLCVKLSSLHLEGTLENHIETHQSVDTVDRGLDIRKMNFIPEQHTLIGDKLLAKVSKLTGGLENEQACQSLEGVLLTEFRGHQSFVLHTELANTLFRCLQATYDTSGFGKLLTKWLNSTEEDEHLAKVYARCVMGSIACLCNGGKVDACLCQRAVSQPEDSKIQRRLFQESERFETPRTSPIDSPETVTPEEIENIYVNGSQMTKADIDVWRALEEVPIDAMRFPMVAMWKQVMTQSKEELKQLQTPRGTHLKLKIPTSGSLLATPTRRIAVSATGSPVSSLPPLLLGLSDSKSRISLPRTRLRL